MTVQDTLRSLDLPRQAPPPAPPLAPTPVAAPPVPEPEPVPVPLLGRDRPLTTDERQFALGLLLLVVVLGTIVVGGLLLGQYAWS